MADKFNIVLKDGADHLYPKVAIENIITSVDGSSVAVATESYVTSYVNSYHDSTKANDNAVVHLSGNETIQGNKTFKNAIKLLDNVNEYSFTLEATMNNNIQYLNIKDEAGVPVVIIPEYGEDVICQSGVSIGNNITIANSKSIKCGNETALTFWNVDDTIVSEYNLTFQNAKGISFNGNSNSNKWVLDTTNNNELKLQSSDEDGDGAYFTLSKWSLSTTYALTIGNHIFAGTNGYYDIGSSSSGFKDLYLTNNLKVENDFSINVYKQTSGGVKIYTPVLSFSYNAFGGGVKTTVNGSLSDGTNSITMTQIINKQNSLYRHNIQLSDGTDTVKLSILSSKNTAFTLSQLNALPNALITGIVCIKNNTNILYVEKENNGYWLNPGGAYFTPTSLASDTFEKIQ